MKRATFLLNCRHALQSRGLCLGRPTRAGFIYAHADSLRRSRLRQPLIALAGATAGMAVLSAYSEPGPDETALPREYDVDGLASYWRERPWAVRMRCIEVVWELFPLAVRFLVDRQLGRFNGDAALCHDHAVNTRETLTRLGPAFIKLGQALSIRPDILPAVALKELQRLCDACPAFPWEQAKMVLEAELGCDIQEVFMDLEASPEPIAAASLGQVYRWRLLKDGSVVAVKVQRPNMANAVALDLYILRQFAWMLRWFIRRFTKARIDHVALLDAFATGTVKELDYEAEARNQEVFRDAMSRAFRDRVYVPAVCKEHTSRHVLVSEWVNGPRLSDCSPEVVRSLCPVGVECFMAQLLDLGLFHSDPHPGNLLVSEGRLVLLDFGLVAEITELNLHRHATAVVNLINGNYDELLDDFIALGFLPEDIDKQRVIGPIRSVLEQGMKAGADMKRRKKNFQAISDDLNDIFFEFPFMVPAYFALVTRALATLEGIALLGDPEFDIFWAAYPYALSRVTAILGPKRTGGLLSAAAAHAAQQMTAPERARMVWAAARTTNGVATQAFAM